MTTQTRITGPVSPIDGRYKSKTQELGQIFSEQALMRYRTIVEIEWLIFLTKSHIIRGLFTEEEVFLREIPEINDMDFAIIKDFEEMTKHDVKAVEYFIHHKMQGTSTEDLIGFVHIGLTSEDVNNMAYALMYREGTEKLHHYYTSVRNMIESLAIENKTLPMLARTHGQPASPTTLGKEMKVFSERLSKFILKIENFYLSVKWGGATGGHNALIASINDAMWARASKQFAENFNVGSKIVRFEYNFFTTQIEPHDTYAELFSIFITLNNILIDFSRDVWQYISHEIFKQKVVKDEVGSSAMPQKVNPIMFENAEAHLGMANALLDHFKSKLPISRLQRDLSDSAVERYVGEAFAMTSIALQNLQAGMKKIYPDKDFIYSELENHWEVVSEAYQVVLRVNGQADAYEKLKEFTRGEKITKEKMHSFLENLYDNHIISVELFKKMMAITPHNYIGNCADW